MSRPESRDAAAAGATDAARSEALESLDAGPLVRDVGAALVAMGAEPHSFKRMVSFSLPKARIHEALRIARDGGFVLLSDVLGIDWLTYPRHRGKRFSVIYNLYAIEGNERVFLRVDLDEGETLPTVTDLWAGANFQEREVYDMFGVVFSGHPDLRKLLTPEDLEGHPHRKDFPLGETPTLFNDGRFLDPAAFRAGLSGASRGLTGWVGGARKGVVSEVARPPGVDDADEGSTP